MKTLLKHIFVISCALLLCSCGSVQIAQDHIIHKTPILTKVRLTAYHVGESDHKKYKNKSAIGTVLRAGYDIATNWAVWPVHTILKINGHPYEVTDYGSFIKIPHDCNTIDVCVKNKSDMNKFGLQYTSDIEIIKMGSFQESAQILSKRLAFSHCREMYNTILANNNL